MMRDAIQQGAAVIRALRNERLTPDQVRRRQDRSLRRMVEYAWNRSRFYRDKFEAAGVRPEDIRSIADLARLPTTTKTELQRYGITRALARGYSPANTFEDATSGSSGTVMKFYHSREAYNRYFAFAYRHLAAIGYRPWHRVAYTAYERLTPLPWERLGLGRRERVDLTQADPRGYVADLLRVRPHFITAYPSILQLILATATPAELSRIRPRAIHLHSELLTEGLRRQISEGFQCDCFDDYGAFEFHHIAYECPRHRYHLAADNVIVEFVRDGRPAEPGEEGEILLTGLSNRAMPLFRYAIGDVGVPGDEICPCGSGFPTMKLVQGRVDDFVVLPSGRRLSPRAINPVYEHLPGLLEHVLIQESLDHVLVRVNVAEAHRDSTPAVIERELGALFGGEVRVEVRLTARIARGRTGKLRTVISKVTPR
ncbi:phenylacetate--CoA ligase family protein [Acrocarpospora macrocephala]|nr:phenylacetate--CoA ligase family protein [Acrocarpospora macrocephala]